MITLPYTFTRQYDLIPDLRNGLVWFHRTDNTVELDNRYRLVMWMLNKIANKVTVVYNNQTFRRFELYVR